MNLELRNKLTPGTEAPDTQARSRQHGPSPRSGGSGARRGCAVRSSSSLDSQALTLFRILTMADTAMMNIVPQTTLFVFCKFCGINSYN